MAYQLTREQQLRAAEIKSHDWSDAPYRRDRAGHQRADDANKKHIADQLTPEEADYLKWNVVVTTGQVEAYLDPNFDIYVFAEACGLPRDMIYNKRGGLDGGLIQGLRMNSSDGKAAKPGP